MLHLAQTDEEIMQCFPVMLELRPQLHEDTFLTTIRDLMQEGYQLAYLKHENRVACVAGFKIAKNLFLGKKLYVEDLSTTCTARSTGLGKRMMEGLRDYAKQNGCNAIHLDSGVQRHRAHRFYLNQNMDIVCYHFVEKFD